MDQRFFSFEKDNESQNNVAGKEGFDLIAAPQAIAKILDNHPVNVNTEQHFDKAVKTLKPENDDEFVFVA